MENTIKPIETVYNGYRFRSRLEARWAVFFDCIGIKYEYEYEGYDLGNGIYYLPDFYLVDAKQFFEVKGIMTEINVNKIELLSEKTGKYVIIGDGQFGISGCEPYNGFCSGTRLVKCKKCGTLYFENGMSWDCTSCGYYDGDSTFECVSSEGTVTRFDHKSDISMEMHYSYLHAKQARFEHGENPSICNQNYVYKPDSYYNIEELRKLAEVMKLKGKGYLT